MLNTFDKSTTDSTFARLNKINFDSKPLWGKMNAAQMLAHLNVAYDLAFDIKSAKSSWFTKILLKTFVKKIVVGTSPYPKNSRTSPDFLITDDKDFEVEKARFITFVKDTEVKGSNYFEGKESASFGALSAKEWSIMFYKHIDHHFTQFGV